MGSPGGRLSPIARRAFLRRTGAGGLGLLAGAAWVGGCSYSDASYSDVSGDPVYCNGCGRSYYHSDGAYCNYMNYSDGC